MSPQEWRLLWSIMLKARLRLKLWGIARLN